MPRFLAVTFPTFMRLAFWCEEHTATDCAVAVLTAVVGLFTAEFATWWIS